MPSTREFEYLYNAQATLTSVDDPFITETGTTPSGEVLESECHVDDDRTHFLLKALTNFIVPIVRTQVIGLGKRSMNGTFSDVDRLDIGPEAKQLVAALQNFVASLMCSPSADYKGAGIPKVKDIREEGRRTPCAKPMSTVVENPAVSLSPNIGVAYRSPEQAVALEKVRNQVFNRMPIRLLAWTFDGDDPEIKLLDRNAIWDRLSSYIETHFIGHGFDAASEEYGISEIVERYASYAILSHTWIHQTPGEVTYADWKDKKYHADSPGYQKLVNFCRVAAHEHKITLAWMDTVCINKDSSTELDESIRSMYKWYQNASVCITYLGQTTKLEHMRDDPWFTRGWTLQELIAPPYIKFYGKEWQKFYADLVNDKEHYIIQQEIHAATTITSKELRSPEPWFHFSISRKMHWAANRQVTREEETAYSLMGIFGVSFSIAYGEGADQAFARLVKEILNSNHHDVQDLLNFGSGPFGRIPYKPITPSSLMPRNPKQYLRRTNKKIRWYLPSTPITLTHLGLHLTVLLMPAISTSYHTSFEAIGSYYATVDIPDGMCPNMLGSMMKIPGQHYNVLDKKSRNNNNVREGDQRLSVTFAVLNFAETEYSVNLQADLTCFTIFLLDAGNSSAHSVEAAKPRRIQTSSGFAFQLQTRREGPNARNILKTKLEKHGMELRTMYL